MIAICVIGGGMSCIILWWRVCRKESIWQEEVCHYVRLAVHSCRRATLGDILAVRIVVYVD